MTEISYLDIKTKLSYLMFFIQRHINILRVVFFFNENKYYIQGYFRPSNLANGFALS